MMPPGSNHYKPTVIHHGTALLERARGEGQRRGSVDLEQDWKQKNKGEGTKTDCVCVREYVPMYMPVCIYVCVCTSMRLACACVCPHIHTYNERLCVHTHMCVSSHLVKIIDYLLGNLISVKGRDS